MDAPQQEPSTKVAVAGIGASAGGLEALERLLRTTPRHAGVAYVIVQHLSPDHDSVMDELLSRCTSLPVRRVEDGTVIEPDTVYVIPPRKELIISGNQLLLADKNGSHDRPFPIDVFFRSLAQERGPMAMGVVLSGTGSDGSQGVREIHDVGGLVLCQSPQSAKFDGMPRSALDTGIVDLALPPEQLGQAILNYVEHASAAPQGLTSRSLIEQVLTLLRRDQGVDFSVYKRNTVGRRIERRVVLRGLTGLDQYVELLESEASERDTLYRDLLIGVTKFFRDREAFERLGRKVLPELVSQLPPDDELRVWCAGCATGEEAYTVAMLVHETFEMAGRPVRAKIFATDVHRISLESASSGIYPASALEEVTPRRRDRFFVASGDSYKVGKVLRQMVVFAPHNVIADAPFTRLDLITCRNLLIYLDVNAQKKVLSLFLFGLKKGGALMLGRSENASVFADELDTVDQASRIFRKRRDRYVSAEMRRAVGPATGAVPGAPSAIRSPHAFRALMRTYDWLLAEFMPMGLLIGEDRQLLHSFGGANRFMRVRDGRPSVDVLDLLVPELRGPVTGLLQRAHKGTEPVTLRGVELPSESSRICLTARRSPVAEDEPSILLTFELAEADVTATPPPPELELELGELTREQIRTLERELQHTKESLQATIEELEASNEEMQATNEELVASNEELQSTNEELQSVNEELYTVNAEFQKKIKQLTELTADMDHLLATMEVGTVFLDEELRIRKFSPLAAETFNLLAQDTGRSIESFRHRIAHDGLLDDIRAVLARGERCEREVRDLDGTWYLMRILPYLVEGNVRGAVVTLIDVAALKEAEERVRKAVIRRDEFLAMLSHELRNPLAAIVNAVHLLSAQDLNDPTIRRALDVMDRQSKLMSRLLDDLLDVSRVTRNKIQLRRELVDVREVVRAAVEALAPRFEAALVSLEVDEVPDPLVVDGDATRLQQLLGNLLSNSAKYNREGGRAWLRIARQGPDVVLRVIDDGVGMSEEMLESAFEPFMQSDRSLSRSDGGMGVGLTLVRAIVEMHGGTIRAHSGGPGRGCEMVVRIPAADGARPWRLEPNGPPRGVLVVEDEVDNRETLSSLLERQGFEVEQVQDAESALARVRERAFDAAVIDIGLPRMDGYELARELREHVEGLRLIALTGFGSVDDKEKATAAGFDEHLVKPIDFEALQRVLRDRN